MKIGINTGGIAREQQSGVGGHTLALLEQFKRFRDQFSLHIINDVPPEFNIPRDIKYHPKNAGHILSRVFQDHVGVGLKGNKENLDLLHCPKTAAPGFFNGVTTITVHDLIFKKFPESYSVQWRWYWNLTLTLSLKRADHVVTVSDSTKRDLREIMGVPEKKITVIPNGIGFEHYQQKLTPLDELTEQYDIPSDYLLSVGHFFPRKNLSRLLKAFRAVHDDYEQLNLVMAGPGGEGADELLNTIEELDLNDRVHLPGYVEYEDLPGLYAEARGLVYPSLDEGFGMPILEAFAVGTPVACSNRAVFKEIGDDLPVYFDPESIQSIEEGLNNLLGDSQFNPDRAKDIARDYRWDTIGDRYRTLFENLLQESE